jgi:hypothetical protein
MVITSFQGCGLGNPNDVGRMRARSRYRHSFITRIGRNWRPGIHSRRIIDVNRKVTVLTDACI